MSLWHTCDTVSHIELRRNKFAALYPDGENRNIRRRDTRNSGRLAQGARPDILKLGSCLRPKTRHGSIIEPVRNGLVFERPELRYVRFLPVDVARILDLNFNLLSDVLCQRGIAPW